MLQCRLRVRNALLSRIQSRACSHRVNPVGIQMLPHRLLEKVFPNHQAQTPDAKVLSMVRDHLETHKLLNLKIDRIAEPDIDVPALDGSSISTHFQNIGSRYSQPYLDAIEKLIKSKVPTIPAAFAFQAGWVRYSKDGANFKSVESPKGEAIVFDVETIVTEGGMPAMAVALTANHWYSWCSPALAEGRDHRVEEVTPDVLIPINQGSKKNHCVIIGHNVGFDRGYIRDQYSLENSNTRFLDTLSMHVCVSGLTSEQKIMTMSVRKKRAAFEEHLKKLQVTDAQERPAMSIRWMTVSSLNNLGDVHRLYCGRELEKSARDTFVTGSSDDVRKDFQYLMKYCASDVLATRNVLCNLYPLYKERFPHPATIFGLLETLTAYLPINGSWKKYLESSKKIYEELDSEIQRFLNEIANENCALLENHAYKLDPWLWDLDWSTREETQRTSNVNTEKGPKQSNSSLNSKPKWFRDLCDNNVSDELNVPEWESGPWISSLQRRCIPKLLKITWDGYPVHYHNELGWGYLAPSGVDNKSDKAAHKRSDKRAVSSGGGSREEITSFPLDAYLEVIDEYRRQHPMSPADENVIPDESAENLSELGDFSKLDNDWNEVTQKSHVYATTYSTKKAWPWSTELNYDIGLKGVKFRKLPQRRGSTYNVGTPLSRSMIEKYWGKRLNSCSQKNVAKLFDLAKNTAYWKTVRDRISEQVAVWTSENQGAILPRILPAGTMYRKPVDRTWSTTSFAARDRIGSEFKAMIQAPKDFHFVGDPGYPNELWIAALLGDAECAQMHGSTAFSWRVLQGALLPEIGLHRETANIVDCTEQQAKVLDLIRLHGGGLKPLCDVLSELCPDKTRTEVTLRIKQLLQVTKGTRKWKEPKFKPVKETSLSPYRRLLEFEDGKRYSQVKKWSGGSESHVFNRIEKIAAEFLPATPFLEARVTRALEPRNVMNKYALARMNWVLQSSVADFQHLSLLSTKHLFDEFSIKGRLVLTMNEGIVYMVKSKHRYKAALALHISNLYVRSFFAERVGMDDLPHAVAFCPFISVDKVLRRHAADDCVTPSNPNGLQVTYGITSGESLDIHETLKKLARSS